MVEVGFDQIDGLVKDLAGRRLSMRRVRQAHVLPTQYKVRTNDTCGKLGYGVDSQFVAYLAAVRSDLVAKERAGRIPINRFVQFLILGLIGFQFESRLFLRLADL